jgi:Tol biopolymer transport system component
MGPILGAISLAGRTFVLVALAVVLAAPATAPAAFPGANGKLTFSSPRNGFPTESNIYTMGADGSAQTRITSFNGDDLYPVWSPDGARIAFQQDPGLHPEIWTSKADGTDLRRLTNNSADDLHPAWSPDGAKIVFASDLETPGGTSSDLFVMNAADGSGAVNITNTPAVDEDYPAWSPEGTKIAFSRDGDIATIAPNGTGLVPLTATAAIEIEPDWAPNGAQLVFRTGINSDDEIFKMNANGSGVTNLTNTGPSVEEHPVWSPAGDRIAFVKGAFSVAEVWTMNSSGTGQIRITTNSFLDAQPNWQPVLSGYPRPSGTGRFIAALVPAYAPCASANRTHGPPLAHPSCNPPVQTSPYLTVGTADANGKTTSGVSRLVMTAVKGNPSTTADEANVKLGTRVTDVLRRSGFTDYAGEIRMELLVRVTDKNNTPHPGGPGAGTGSFALGWTVPCRTTAITTRGGDCVLGTTADALVPGMVKESARAIWQMDQVRVYDGGADSDADTAADNRLFFVQGVFVP